MPGWVQAIDDDVLRWLHENQAQITVLHRTASDLTALGGRVVLALFAVFALGLLLAQGRLRRALLFAVVVVGAYLTSDFLKDHVARVRPVVAGVKAPASPSFPSSHASLTMVIFVAAALALRGTLAGRGGGAYLVAWAVLVSLLVGLTRVYLRVHFLSDVVAGWLLGLGFVLVFWLLDRLTGGAGERAAG